MFGERSASDAMPGSQAPAAPQTGGPRRILTAHIFVAALLALALGSVTAQAQDACATDIEPNETAETAQPSSGAFCLEGSIGEGDQEIIAWSVDDESARRPWTIRVKGPRDQQTRLQIHRLEEPGDAANPAVVGPELVALVTPAGADTVERLKLFVSPGTWLVGISVSPGAGGAYRVDFEAGEPAPSNTVDNASPEAASPVAATFSTQGVLAQSEAWYAWQLSAVEARKRWTLTATAPLGASVGFELQTTDGKPLLAATRIAEGKLRLPDIGLPAGTYRIHLKTNEAVAYPFSLVSESQGPRSPGREEEPNDAPLTARPLALGQAMAGRISQPGDVDTYLLPPTAKEQLLAIGIGGPSKAAMRLCVGGADGALLQCREGVGPALSDIAADGRTRFVIVSGGPSPDANYELTARVSGQVSPDLETEPNDVIVQAVPLAEPSMRGRLTENDTDMFRFTVAGSNLRQFSITGEAVSSIEVTDTQNQSSARADRPSDAEGKAVPGPLELKDMALAPGDYILSVSGSGGDYVVTTSATEPPKVVAGVAQEREPNDAEERAQQLVEGERVVAELSPTSDADTYRMTVRARGGVGVAIDVGNDCWLAPTMSWASWSGVSPRLYAKGKGFVYRALLDPGDYIIRVQADMSCEAPAVPYTIGFDLDPDIAEVGDVEPNDVFNIGRPMPADFKVSSTVGEFGDVDWFRLPTVEADTQVTLRVTGDVELMLTDGKASSSSGMALPKEIAVSYFGEPITGVVPAGTTAAVRIKGFKDTAAYTLEVEMAGHAATAPAVAPVGSLTAELALDSKEVAAYWHRGQRVGGTLTLSNGGSNAVEAALESAALPAGWHFEMPASSGVGTGETVTVPVSLEIEPDAYAMRAMRVAISARAAGAAPVTAVADLGVAIEAEPVGDHLTFNLPPELRGGFNVAWSALGGELLPNDQVTASETPEAVNDGLGSNAGFAIDAAKLPVALTIRFGGGRAWPVRGITINPQTPGLFPAEYIQDFELLLSADGQTFRRVLAGRVGTEPREQSFLLPETIEASAAQLRILNNHDGNLGKAGFSEWKVIADPAAGIGSGLDLADVGRGGHIVWSKPLISDQIPVVKGVLQDGDKGPVAAVPAGTRPQFVVGFNENRAAQISAIEWTDSSLDTYARYFPGVLVEASTETPLGPWVSQGEIPMVGEGRSVKTFETPIWARFLRFTSLEAVTEDGVNIQFPTGLRIEERATDANYRSILGEWGQYSPAGFYETTLPPSAARPETSANDTRETAEALAMGEIVSGRVEISRDEDWYRIVQPAEFGLMVVSVGGEPTIGADVVLQDETGAAVALTEISGAPREAVFEARVVPGKTYYVRAAQPPHSVVIAYDTSGSLLSFIPIIFNALEVFASGVTAGHEAVNFMPFDQPPLMPDFSDQKAVLQRTLAKDARESTSSGLEATSIAAMRELAPRRGTRALLLVTDAASSTPGFQTDLWTMVEQIRPRIFSAHVGSFDDPMREKQLLQDLSMASGGHYESSRSQGELDVAFDRVAAWLRRPAGYTLKVEPGTAAPPEPGQLLVTGGAVAAVNTEVNSVEPAAEPAIEIVLDASGSMLKRMGGQRRIEVARNALNKLVAEELERDAPLALRVFGHDRPGSCETALLQPLSPLDPDAMVSTINMVEPQNLAKTPIAESLRMVGEDLADVAGRKTVVLITDGEETCGGDPRAEIQALAARDIEVRVNIVGFAVDDLALKGVFAEWARIGRGRYFDAALPKELDAAVKAATELPYQVFDRGGAIVGAGSVGGDAVVLPAGSYRVEVATTPPRVFESVVIREKQTTELEAGAS